MTVLEDYASSYNALVYTSAVFAVFVLQCPVQYQVLVSENEMAILMAELLTLGPVLGSLI